MTWRPPVTLARVEWIPSPCHHHGVARSTRSPPRCARSPVPASQPPSLGSTPSPGAPSPQCTSCVPSIPGLLVASWTRPVLCFRTRSSLASPHYSGLLDSGVHFLKGKSDHCFARLPLTLQPPPVVHRGRQACPLLSLEASRLPQILPTSPAGFTLHLLLLPPRAPFFASTSLQWYLFTRLPNVCLFQ